MDKCSSYDTQVKRQYLYDRYSGSCIGWENITIGVCHGTKECDECLCGGDRTKCDFYPEVKLKAQKEEIENSLDYKITQAIKLLIDNGYEVKKI